MNAIANDDLVIDALLYGMPTQKSASYFRQEFNNFVDSAVGDYARTLVDRAKNLYNQFNSTSILGMMQAAINKSVSVFKPDTVYAFSALQDFQTAQPMMQTYIMANPEIRGLWQQQRCDGFSESYVDAHPGKIGENHLHWQHVMNGHVQFDEEGMSWTNYSGAFDEDGNTVLSAQQQCIVRDNWRKMIALIKDGDDPTNVWGGKL